MCRVKVGSWGALERVKGWNSFEFKAEVAIRTHCPDLYSNPDGFANSNFVTSETIAVLL